MIKGFCKNAVIVKCKGQLIDEAIFILKKKPSRRDKKAILSEANEIIRERTALMEKARKKSFMQVLDIDD